MKSEGSHHYFLPHTKVSKGVGDTVTPTMRRVRLIKYAYMNSNAMVRNRRKRLECHRSKKKPREIVKIFYSDGFRDVYGTVRTVA